MQSKKFINKVLLKIYTLATFLLIILEFTEDCLKRCNLSRIIYIPVTRPNCSIQCSRISYGGFQYLKFQQAYIIKMFVQVYKFCGLINKLEGSIMVKKTIKSTDNGSPEKLDHNNLQTPKKQEHTKTRLLQLQTTKKKARKQNRSNLPSSDNSKEELEAELEITKNLSLRFGQFSQDNRCMQRIDPQISSQTNQFIKKELKSGELDQNFPLQYYTGRTTYKLDTFNSITIRQGQIYNLLQDPFLRQKQKKEVKCNCSQSRCKAKYCICYSKGKKCGQDCGCTNCANTMNPVRRQDEAQTPKSCKCQKSNCLKNYCQCRKDGQFCNPSCRCINCLNSKPILLENKEPEIMNQKIEYLEIGI